jgi:NadR type nicotinamide-nucleotide adenylyltransferase
MGGDIRLKKIVVTGPESTGKTTLSESLALNLKVPLIPEYARTYIEKLHRPYTYQDVENIALYQVQQEKEFTASTAGSILLMDTWLIMTKVWFDVVFGRFPGWIEHYLASAEIDLFLVCKPDIPWIEDPVRENGGEMRTKLFDRYCDEIQIHGFNFEIVEGAGEIRFRNALGLLKKHLII